MRKLLTYIFLLFTTLAWAQGTSVATGLPFECSFEESENLSAWVLNPGTSAATDKWMIGGAVHSEGKRSLYVSSNGVDPSYGKNPNVVVAYMRYRFPSAGHYDISFDWKGVGDSANSKLYVMVCPESFLSNANYPQYLSGIVSTSTGRLSTPVENACEAIISKQRRYLCGSDLWQNISLPEVNVNSTYSAMPFAIVFIWTNNNRSDTIPKSSIAIDNLQINSANIKKPLNLQVFPQCDDSTMLVTWESPLGEFDIEYRKTGATSWNKAHGLVDGAPGFTRTGSSECSYVLTRILEGTWDVRIRAVSRDKSASVLRTSYVYKTQTLVYCPDNHCVNYIDIHDTSRVVCTYGHVVGYTGTETPYTYIGCVDKGPEAKESRHTVHVDPTEYDEQTEFALKTVPDGALASVRLGNWNTGGEAESITYDILVDSVYQGILIIRYAVVLEKPNPSCGDPGFKMVVLDENGNEIDETCGKADFTYSSAVEAGWNETKKGNVVWKNWTTVGVNLMPYHGQNIKVRFTTMDCDAGGHYGYAYFTLDCANGHLETNSCGNDASITCYAPEGFAYKWYNELGDTVCYDRELIVDAGMHTYTCRVSFIEEPDCYFEISTLSAPRFPVPEYSYEPIYDECTSKIRFTNTSHVMNKFEGYETHTSEPCTDWYWRFRRFSTGQITEMTAKDPVYICPEEGDSIEITYTCYIGAENACDSTRVDTIVVANIIPQNTEFWVTTCPEDPVKFGDCADCWFDADTTVVHTYPNFAGCDSTSTLHLKVWPKVEPTYRHDSICSDGFVKIDGIKYNQPMDNQKITLQTRHGCDSVLYMTLTVNQRIEAELDSLSYVCADDEEMFLTFDLIAGVFDSLEIVFSTPELRDTTIYDSSVRSIAIPYSGNILPGHYTATFSFYQFCCGVYTEERGFDIRYRSSIVEQKWNDVLTLLSPKYNGGYEFLSFQWYKNGEPMEGETHSYLYQSLDTTATYYVEVMRTDSVVMRTCPMQPVHHEQQSDYPTVVTKGQQVPMYMEQPVTVWYYTVSGQYYSSFTLPQGYTTLPVPAQTGIYIIKSVNSEGETRAQKMIVE